MPYLSKQGDTMLGDIVLLKVTAGLPPLPRGTRLETTQVEQSGVVFQRIEVPDGRVSVGILEVHLRYGVHQTIVIPRANVLAVMYGPSGEIEASPNICRNCFRTVQPMEHRVGKPRGLAIGSMDYDKWRCDCGHTWDNAP